ncbi:uncharacterized protein [Triticum aestivum]|uniref:uncharacterized protein n=1 Tax=Triticum aestivum TaxID=4565 RepID=UPI001D011357|nr:uncharacterized protein LOC123046675 [Triticum aestivum]
MDSWRLEIHGFARVWSGVRRSPSGCFAPVRPPTPSCSPVVRAVGLQHLSTAAPTHGLYFYPGDFVGLRDSLLGSNSKRIKLVILASSYMKECIFILLILGIRRGNCSQGGRED